MRYFNFWLKRSIPERALRFPTLIAILTGAGVAEQADAPDLKSGGVKPRAGSSPAPGTNFMEETRTR